MKSLAELQSLIPQIAQCGQTQYDQWSQNEEGYDHEVDYGGICHLIVDEIIKLLNNHLFETVSYSLDSEVHVVTIIQLQEGVFELDIPYRHYETGGGYIWKKIPNVKFDESMVTINKISSDPKNFDDYLI